MVNDANKNNVGALRLAFLGGLALGLSACSTPIHEVITQGTYDGFRIGSSGGEVYQRIQEKYQTRKFESFFMYFNSSSDEQGWRSSYEGTYSLGEAKERYALWNVWQPRLKDGGVHSTLTFQGGLLSRVGGQPNSGWNPRTVSTDRVVLPHGISRDSAYVELEKLSVSDPVFSELRLRLFDKEMNAPYDSAMLEKSRYGPTGAPSGSAAYDRIVWVMIYPGGNENSLALHFKEKKLYRINRDYEKSGWP
jgi:hypothetical protein